MLDTPVLPTVREVETSHNFGRFEIEPLEPGYGTTLGNSLRRVLLSSLPGAAVTAVAIDGVSHEFAVIPHVKEDVGEILLNIKGLSLVCHAPEGARVTLAVTGPRRVTAADIEPTADVEIINPDLYLCSIDSKDGRLRMELTVERGKGYATAEKNKKEGQPIGVMPLDAIFTPVVKANFLIERTRVGQDTDWEKLGLEVWTDGTISPVDAVSQAASYYTSHLELFVRFGESLAPVAPVGRPGADAPSRLAEVPVEELELSVRALNCLKANEIGTVGQLIGMRQEELLALRNFGFKSLEEIKEKLVERGFVAAGEVDSLFQTGAR